VNRVPSGTAHTDAAIDFNVGIDIESVSRFGPDANEAAVLRLFAAEEVAECSGLKDGPSRLAGIWCAKEATVKALTPWVRLDPRRVRVFGAADRRPQVVVLDWSPQQHRVAIRVSIATDGGTAAAWAVAWGPSPSGPDPR
jgi:phosphopantetheine--protein transferase-like protein